MYYDYLDLAERLNKTLPNRKGRSAKIFTWQNRYETKKHGVTAAVILCKPEDESKLEWKNIATDVAVDIKKCHMKEAVIKAYNLICEKLNINYEPFEIKLKNGRTIIVS